MIIAYLLQRECSRSGVDDVWRLTYVEVLTDPARGDVCGAARHRVGGDVAARRVASVSAALEIRRRRAVTDTPAQGNDVRCGFGCHTTVKGRDYVLMDYGKR